MKKKSGLADSPFFSQISPTDQVISDVSPTPVESQSATQVAPNEEPEILKAAEIFQSATLDWQKSSNLPNLVQTVLKMKNDKKTGYRFPLELINELEDLPYQIKKTYHHRVDKTAIFVAALTFYISDFHQHGQESLLYKHLLENERQR